MNYLMFGHGDVRPCTRCNEPLRWDGDRHVWAGEHKPSCPIVASPQRQANEIQNALRPAAPFDVDEADLEYVAGPNGAPLWNITAATGRSVGGVNVIDEFQVRAYSYDGALILAREMRPFIQDAEAVKVDG